MPRVQDCAAAGRLPAWKALEGHHRDVARLHLRELFADDPTRGERFTVEGAGLYLDYSKNRVTAATIALLTQLAEQSGLRSRIDAMFRGDDSISMKLRTHLL
jgi:glucose-6-phosphate isomerase